MQPPTFEAIDRWRAFLGLQWKGDYQRRVAASICAHRYNTVKMPRQTGKTWTCGGLFGSYYLFMGQPVIATFPTIRVGSWVLVDEVNNFMQLAEQKLGKRLRRLKDNQQYKKWSSGGELYLISSDEGSEVEGQHGVLLLWDEAHRSTLEKYSKIKPFLDVAALGGYDKTIMLGIGAGTSGLLSRMTRNELFNAIHITPDDVIEEIPSYKQLCEEAMLLMGDIYYRKNYLCEDIDEGERILLPHVPALAEYAAGFPPDLRFAIDVGRHSDITQVGVFERRPASFAGQDGQQYQVINWIDRQVIPNISFCDWYTDTRTGETLTRQQRQEIDPKYVVEHKGQGHLIHDYIMQYKPEHGWISPEQVKCERNAIGEGLFDELAANWFPGLSSIYITNQTKDAHGVGYRDRLVGRLRVMCRSGLFGCQIPLCRENLVSLRYTTVEKDGAVVLEIDHSDDLSVALIGISGF